jgi:glycosyltransferase involved in cell wall biosynthesis
VNNKKIVFVTNSSLNFYLFRRSIAKALYAEGYKIVVVAKEDTYTGRIMSCPEISLFIPLKSLDASGRSIFQEIKLLKELYAVIKQVQPHTIFSFTIKPNIYCGFITRLFGTPFVPTITGLGYTFIHTSWLTVVIKLLYRIAFAKAQVVLFHNSTDLRLFIQERIIEHAQGQVTAGSGVDTQYYKPSKHSLQPFTFTFIGRLLIDKGIKEFIEASKIIQSSHESVQSWIIGDINTNNPSTLNKQQLEDLLINSSIKYWGEVDDIRPILAETNVLVLPSYREGMPRVVLEALSMGCGVITTDTAGCRESITEECGILVPVKDSHAIAEAMIEFLNKEDHEWTAIRAAARKRAIEVFDIAHVTQEYIKLLEPIM